MPGVRIRRFGPGDGDAVRRLHENATRNASDFVEGVPEPDLADVPGHYLDGEVVATGGYRAGEGERSGTTDGSVALVGHLRVRPDVQRRGYARAIVAALEERARDDRFERFVLETHEDLVAAREFYEDLGYSVTTRVPHAVTGDEMFHYGKDLCGQPPVSYL